MSAVEAFQCLFNESGLAKPDTSQPVIMLQMAGETRWFTRNLIQCFILEVQLDLEQRKRQAIETPICYVQNGKLRLPGVKGGGNGGASSSGGAALVVGVDAGAGGSGAGGGGVDVDEVEPGGGGGWCDAEAAAWYEGVESEVKP